ncbi:MAG: CoB--CoM heterodisulfide reductase iron-sulfur subunit A family protein, partial [Thermoplasmata archaeon]|nr:CoB--CoM heterodisulfide reductase iron-sulfur subunit A family protein [Thermoplasmata archaeon]
LVTRKAIYVKYPQAVPAVYAIDREHCIGCGICQGQCEAEAIQYEQETHVIDIEVGSIIVAPGFDLFDLTLKPQYGYGAFPNVVSSLELERMLSATGPHAGMVLRPSDGDIPRNIAFIQCVGSRDSQIGNTYCSSVCCMFSIKEAVIAQEHMPGLKTHIFFMDMRAYGKEFDEYYSRAEKEHSVKFTRGNRISSVEEDLVTHNLYITYVDGADLKMEEFDLVVLSVGTRPPADADKLSMVLGIDLNKHDFCKTSIFDPLTASKPGIYVCGSVNSPKDIPDSVAQASGAASKASSHISTERNKLVAVREFPQETDVGGEEPRIGVFVCHCGINIGGVVDVPSVVEYAKELPNVAYAEDNLYTCSQDTQSKIVETIKEHNLNRVIVASCTPRTHSPLFMNTIREAGLNPYLFEMANIREHCSWVHSKEPEKATTKAKDLVRMAVAKARLLEQLPHIKIPIGKSALVIGGGYSGMTAALGIAEQGFDAYLIERESELGGITRRIHFTLTGEDVQARLKGLVDKVEKNEKVHIFTGAKITDIEGFVGNFTTTVEHEGEEKQIRHGVVVVATGGKELKPNEYLYGEDPRVLTQLEYENMLVNGGLKDDVKSVAMIQCVGSRTEERPYCSRICCTETVKNAIETKKAMPDANVYVFHRDMRTYGFREDYYLEAARIGVIFVRYYPESPPKLTLDNGVLQLTAVESLLDEEICVNPDLVMLAVATLPNDGNDEISSMLKVPLTRDKFFLEAHMKLRPVDFASEGVFLCGLAHSPKFIEECISQADATASRAATILSKDELELEATKSLVIDEKCDGCAYCIEPCPYDAISLIEYMREGTVKKTVDVDETACKGCGVCQATCPKGGILVRGFTLDQIESMIEAALGVA